ncbi:MAG: hypothetical protein FWG25_05335 [Promicromonosporaceae bacterium]|nr:hypothetical protein [Promicromonosporaceae bacterium]
MVQAANSVFGTELAASATHADCDCVIIVLQVGEPDPDWLTFLLGIVAAAKLLAGDGAKDEEVCYWLRRLQPELVTDGVEPPALTQETYSVADDDGMVRVVLPISYEAWAHILERHSENGSAPDTFGSMLPDEIADMVHLALTNPLAQGPAPKPFKGWNFHQWLPDGREFIVATKRNAQGDWVIKTAFPPSDPKYWRLTNAQVAE